MLLTDFKQAMRRLASTITIITAGRGKARVGMAATAVTSVTADPPTILISVNRATSISPILETERMFCVNLLSGKHGDLVGVFGGAQKAADRFSFGSWTETSVGVPMLADASSAMLCRVAQSVIVGTHTLYIGEVVEIVNHAVIDPLVWFDGQLAVAQKIVR